MLNIAVALMMISGSHFNSSIPGLSPFQGLNFTGRVPTNKEVALWEIGHNNHNYISLQQELNDAMPVWSLERRDDMYKLSAEYRAKILAQVQHLSLTADCQCALSQSAPGSLQRDCSIVKFKAKKKRKKNNYKSK